MCGAPSPKNVQVGGGEEGGISASVVDPEIETRSRVIASHTQPGSIGRREAPRPPRLRPRQLRDIIFGAFLHPPGVPSNWVHMMRREERSGLSLRVIFAGSTDMRPDHHLTL